MASIVNKQQEQLKQAAREVANCDVCRKGNRPLFACTYDNCEQANRMLCNRCGIFTHDDDCDHEFETSQDYIHLLTVTFELDNASKRKIKKNAKEVGLMAASLQEQKDSGPRNGFWNAMANGGNAIMQLDREVVANYVRNEKYFAEAFGRMAGFLRNGGVKQFSQEMKTVLFDMGDASFEVTKQCKEGAFAAAGLMFVAEFSYLTIQFARGKFTAKQYGQKVFTAIGTSAGACLGNIGGSAMGAAIGTFVCPGVGTAIGSALGGLLGALFVAHAAKKSIESISWFNDKNEQAIRKQMMKEALVAFGFTSDDIKNESVFNEREIGRIYRHLAKLRHPDRGGSAVQFQKLNGDMALLLSLLEKPKYVKKEISKTIKAISLPSDD